MIYFTYMTHNNKVQSTIFHHPNKQGWWNKVKKSNTFISTKTIKRRASVLESFPKDCKKLVEPNFKNNFLNFLNNLDYLITNI
jgi:hypothetical protein